MTIELLLTLLAGTLGGFIFFRLKVPAGTLVGAIFAVAVLSVATPYASMPLSAKLVAQIITGAYIGSTIQKRDILRLPRIIGPYLMLMGGFFVLNIVSAFIIYLVAPIDFLTALLCAMPGGVSDTPLIAMDMGADAAKVAVLQFVRMIFGMGALPFLIVVVNRMADKRRRCADAPACQAAGAFEPPSSAAGDSQTPPQADAPCELPPQPAPQPAYSMAAVVTLLVAAAGALLGKRLGIPAGALAFAMLATVSLKMLYNPTNLPSWCRRVAQVLSGCCIGSQITRQDMLEMRYLLLPALILVVGYFANCIIMGSLLNRCFKIPRIEAMLSVAPAGASEMALISADLGVHSPDLVVLQLCRLFGVMTIFPQLFGLLLKFVG